MSTSIAASVGPRASGPEHIASGAVAAQHHEEEARKEQVSSAEAVAFITPVVKVDNNTGLALLVVRDGSTGEELDQYPSKKVVEEYQRVQGAAPKDSSGSGRSSDGSQLASDASVPPAPVAAPPVSPATGDARTTVPSAPAVSSVAPATN